MSESETSTPPVLPHCPLWARVIATGFGVGYIPFAPGTFGSLAALLVFWKLPWLDSYLIALLGMHHHDFILESARFISSLFRNPLVLTLLYCIIGIPASSRFAAGIGQHDPKAAVIDEFAGQTLTLVPLVIASQVTMGFVCISPMDYLLAFLMFRLLDIWKPWPISSLEYLPGGWGIMLDDLAAGCIAGLSLLIVHNLFFSYLMSCVS